MHAEYKQTAIRGLAMGTENRVAMLFDKARTCTAACARAYLHACVEFLHHNAA